MKKSFDEVKHLLFDSGISNYRISKATGIAQSTLSDYVNHKTKIERMPVETAIKLHNYYLEELEKMTVPVKKISVYNDEKGNPFIYRAWNMNEVKVVSEDDEVRPSLIIENGLLIGIETNGLDLVIPEFDPVPLDNSLIFLRKKNPNEFSEGVAWQYVLTSIGLITVSKLGDLRENYKEILEAIENELDTRGNEEFKSHVMDSLNSKINKYKKTKVWDLSPGEKTEG